MVPPNSNICNPNSCNSFLSGVTKQALRTVLALAGIFIVRRRRGLFSPRRLASN